MASGPERRQLAPLTSWLRQIAAPAGSFAGRCCGRLLQFFEFEPAATGHFLSRAFPLGQARLLDTRNVLSITGWQMPELRELGPHID